MKAKNWTVEKKDEIETILIEKWASMDMTIPDNYEDIVQICYEDICENAGAIHWNEGDVMGAFRRWIESQSNDNVQPDNSPQIGDKISTVGELRSIMSDLNDEDIICIETTDLKIGDAVDLYPMYVDVIDLDGKTNEVRFCQMDNVQPKEKLVDAVIEDLKNGFEMGDYTVLGELLEMLPEENLIHSLPEEKWDEYL